LVGHVAGMGQKKDTYSGWGDLKETDHLEDLRVDGDNIIMSLKKNHRVWTGSMWLRVGTNGRCLTVQLLTCGLHKVRGI